MTVEGLETESIAEMKGWQTPWLMLVGCGKGRKKGKWVPFGKAITQQSISPLSSIRRTSSAVRFS